MNSYPIYGWIEDNTKYGGYFFIIKTTPSNTKSKPPVPFWVSIRDLGLILYGLVS